VIVKKMPEDLLGETADLTSAIHEALGGMGDNAYKEIDLILTDEATFNDYRMHAARSTTTSTGRGCGLSRLVGVLTDIHGDIFALDAALGRLREMGCDPIFCAGDLIEMEPFGEEVIQRLKSEKNVICIKGNHERWR